MAAPITTRSMQPLAQSCESLSTATSSCQATLTAEASRTCSPETLPVTRNATSSRVADCGPLRHGSQDGPTSDLFGPAPARASRSARRASNSEQMIQGICGRTFIASSVPAGPLSSWESKLRERLATIGSTESALIWKEKATKGGQSISRLAPSMRHTNGIDCTGSLWTTVSARDWKDSAGMTVEAKDGRIRLDQLLRQMVSYSATPRASDGEKGGPNMSFGAGGTPLPAQMYAYNRSPTAGEKRGGAYSDPAKAAARIKSGHTINLEDEMVVTAHGGQTPNGSSARSTAKRGAPNPAFPFWLMGFPDEWTSGALAAMQSYRSSQRKSSPHSSKQSDSRS